MTQLPITIGREKERDTVDTITIAESDLYDALYAALVMGELEKCKTVGELDALVKGVWGEMVSEVPPLMQAALDRWQWERADAFEKAAIALMEAETAA